MEQVCKEIISLSKEEVESIIMNHIYDNVEDPSSREVDYISYKLKNETFVSITGVEVSFKSYIKPKPTPTGVRKETYNTYQESKGACNETINESTDTFYPVNSTKW